MKNNTKRNNAIKILLALWILTAANRLMAQNTVGFNQYPDNLTSLNPAYSLLDKSGSLNLLGRRQFVGVDGAPSTFLFNANMSVSNIQGAMGLFVMNDQYGVTHQTEVNAYFAKSIRISETGYLGAAINAGVQSFTSGFSQLDATDPQFSTDIRQAAPNAGLGLMYYTDTYYLGFSAPQLLHLNSASVDYFKSSYYFSGALIAPLANGIQLKPATLVALQSNLPAIVNVSATVYLKELFGIGANYSSNKQFSGLISLQTSNFRIGYSYEVSTGAVGLAGFNNSTSEVSLSYRFGKASAKLL